MFAMGVSLAHAGAKTHHCKADKAGQIYDCNRPPSKKFLHLFRWPGPYITTQKLQKDCTPSICFTATPLKGPSIEGTGNHRWALSSYFMNKFVKHIYATYFRPQKVIGYLTHSRLHGLANPHPCLLSHEKCHDLVSPSDKDLTDDRDSLSSPVKGTRNNIQRVMQLPCLTSQEEIFWYGWRTKVARGCRISCIMMSFTSRMLRKPQ